MSKEQNKPSDSLIQDLLAERRELKIAVERMKLEVEDARQTATGGDQRMVKELQDEVERLRYQLASARAEATQLREERDALRGGIERALDLMAAEEAE